MSDRDTSFSFTSSPFCIDDYFRRRVTYNLSNKSFGLDYLPCTLNEPCFASTSPFLNGVCSFLKNFGLLGKAFLHVGLCPLQIIQSNRKLNFIHTGFYNFSRRKNKCCMPFPIQVYYCDSVFFFSNKRKSIDAGQFFSGLHLTLARASLPWSRLDKAPPGRQKHLFYRTVNGIRTLRSSCYDSRSQTSRSQAFPFRKVPHLQGKLLVLAGEERA